jgi:hypothetical protein
MTTDSTLTSATPVMRNHKIVDAEIDGEIVALHIEKGTCYGLNKVGSRVWQLAATPRRVADICRALRDEYDVSAATCEEQVLALLEGLRAEGLIDTVDQDVSATDH